MVKSKEMKFTLKGRCNNINLELKDREPRGLYYKLYVSDGSLGDIKESKEEKILCNNCSYKDGKCDETLDIVVNINKTKYTCVILEKYMQIAGDEWIAKRELIVGRYRGQKMIDVREEYNKRKIG
jgi:hypothetical protein